MMSGALQSWPEQSLCSFLQLLPIISLGLDWPLAPQIHSTCPLSFYFSIDDPKLHSIQWAWGLQSLSPLTSGIRFCWVSWPSPDETLFPFPLLLPFLKPSWPPTCTASVCPGTPPASCPSVPPQLLPALLANSVPFSTASGASPTPHGHVDLVEML